MIRAVPAVLFQPAANNLAGAYETVGDLGRAVPLYEQTADGCRRVLGVEHPTTKVVEGNQAAVRGQRQAAD